MKMIRANELRIGNWVNLIALDQKIQIKSISSTNGLKGLYTWLEKGEEYEDSLSAINGIPLSPEVLISAGFKQHSEMGSLFFLNEFRYDTYRKQVKLLRPCDKAGESQKESCGFPFITDQIQCPHLHQLQNLYFALTGTELEYKP